MNATVVATAVQRVINDVGNSVNYYNPLTTTGNMNTEGEWDGSHATTASSFKWVEPQLAEMLELNKLGAFNLKENECIFGSDVTVALRGKCTSNSIDWLVEDIKPIRIKDTVIANVVSLQEQ